MSEQTIRDVEEILHDSIMLEMLCRQVFDKPVQAVTAAVVMAASITIGQAKRGPVIGKQVFMESCEQIADMLVAHHLEQKKAH